MKHLPLILILLTTAAKTSTAQNKGVYNDYKTERAAVVYPSSLPPDFNPVLQNMEMPHPGSGSYRAYLFELKKKLADKYPDRYKSSNPNHVSAVPQPTLNRGFKGNNYNNSVPNDNNMAISNGGILLSAINSTLWAWDVNDSDTLIFTSTLAQLALPLLINQSKFDPKLVYDPVQDRFIITFLNGFTPSRSYLVLAFSSTNDPRDPWYLFKLPGNPLNDNTWSDYPAMVISNDEVFITLNLLYPDSSWQTGFKQSIIWQVDKNAAFAGDSVISQRLWYNINFNGKAIRNLNPIKGGLETPGPNMFFLSNRNFDLQNDTVFIVETTGNLSDPNAELIVKYGISDVKYGVPPFAQQANGHTFDTNDGRILGGFIENRKIQFVGNTAYYLVSGIDTFLYAAVYHGFVDSLDNEVPTVRGHIFYDPDTVLDLGYPNIAFAGTKYCDEEAFISFDHTAPSVFSGSSCVFYSEDGQYSDLLTLKAGDNYVNILSGTYERWGDYSGIQRKFDEEGKIWCATSYGDANRRNATWISELTMPSVPTDTGLSNTLQSVIDTTDQSAYLICDGALSVTVSGGVPPYTYLWSDTASQTTPSISGLCKGLYSVTVTDAGNCSSTFSADVGEPAPEANIFPNPPKDQIFVHFNLENDKVITIALYDMKGGLVKILLDDLAEAGDNLFSFSTRPLASGSYVVRITSNDETIWTERFIRY
ncbi:MAG: T9SS type A sorting domain-containing protein [Flavobacteriales bacterium]